MTRGSEALKGPRRSLRGQGGLGVHQRAYRSLSGSKGAYVDLCERQRPKIRPSESLESLDGLGRPERISKWPSRASKQMYRNFPPCPTGHRSLSGPLPRIQSQKSTSAEQGKGITDHYWPSSVFLLMLKRHGPILRSLHVIRNFLLCITFV